MKKIIVLAAGQGTRMNAELPKILMPLAGKPMIEYLIQSIIKSGADNQPIVVVSPDNKDVIKNALKNYNCQYAIQKRQLGTGHAMMCAKKYINKEASNIICFYGDHPFVKAETIKRLSKSYCGIITIATTIVSNFNDWKKNFYHWGRILRYKGQIEAIIEFKDATNEVKKIKEVNPGFYCFNRKWLWSNIEKLNNNNAQKEYYLTDLINLAFKQEQAINSILINSEEAIGINNKEELLTAEKIIAEAKHKKII
ncbi:MAG: NTP transferase domain-containing protein [Patescibacteria group bacterium]|nr:NTP transferase domain-containing protein [Patescibacteria group bacterium]